MGEKKHVAAGVPLFIFLGPTSRQHIMHAPIITVNTLQTGCFTWLNTSCKVHVELAAWHTVLPSAGTSVQMFLKYG